MSVRENFTNLNMKHLAEITLCLLLCTLTSCEESKFGGEIPVGPSPEDTTQIVKPTISSYNEKYRPQVHFTPAKNWMNDPNGMVYVNGEYHLFYQYNPQGNDWGNMSWGHAVSSDMIQWKEHPVALLGDELGAIFSGSAVVDKNNTAGFGKDAVVALYTSAGSSQQQSIAYSNDGGYTFNKFGGNPVIANKEKPDFRDPKVFWHEESQSWIMVLALGWSYGVEIYSSPNLKNWTSQGVFRTDLKSCNQGQWECPDLLRFEYNGEEKWVMLVSVNPGGPVAGSGTMYFVGSFDGKNFVADSLEYPKWIDFGTDNYAGVTWSNTPNRYVYIGWMNNWLYSGAVPCSPWRSAMTLPRELSLVEVDGLPHLASKVVDEIDNIAKDWESVENGVIGDRDAYQLRLTIDMISKSSYRLENEQGDYLELEFNPYTRMLSAKRNANTGNISFSSVFSFPAIKMPVYESADKLAFDIFVDRSSVEIVSADGLSAMTMLVFPESIYNKVSTDSELDAEVRTLSRIW